MSKKLRISAGSLAELRDFLADADVDMGCRPVAVKEEDRYVTTVVAEDPELERLGRRRSGLVSIDVLEEMPDSALRLRMLSFGNRFRRGQIPRGLGVKE